MPRRTKTPRRSGYRIQLYSRALRERWPIPESVRAEVVKEAQALLRVDNPAVRSRAMAVLLQADALNQADAHLADRNGRLDAGKATERVGVETLILRKPVRPPA